MASPQLENGYTRIANELLEAICRLNLSGNEMRILLYIIRRTYGFNKSYAEIPLSEISNAVGIRREHIQKALKKLSLKKIIELRIHGGIKSQTISIVKNYENWNVESCVNCLLQKLATVAEIGNTTVAEIGNSTYKEKKENIKEREKKNSPPPHAGSYNCAFVNDDNYKELASEYDTEVINNYIDKVDNWAHSKGKNLGECSEMVKKWLEQDDVPKIDPSISAYESVIGHFLPL